MHCRTVSAASLSGWTGVRRARPQHPAVRSAEGGGTPGRSSQNVPPGEVGTGTREKCGPSKRTDATSPAGRGGARRSGTAAPCSVFARAAAGGRAHSRAPEPGAGGLPRTPVAQPSPPAWEGRWTAPQSPLLAVPREDVSWPRSEVCSGSPLPLGTVSRPGQPRVSHMPGRAQSVLGTRSARLRGRNGRPQGSRVRGAATGQASLSPGIFNDDVLPPAPFSCLVTQSAA